MRNTEAFRVKLILKYDGGNPGGDGGPQNQLRAYLDTKISAQRRLPQRDEDRQQQVSLLEWFLRGVG